MEFWCFYSKMYSGTAQQRSARRQLRWKPMGFIIISEEGNFYYSGDTALTVNMELIPKWAKLNFAVLPIGDNFTMDAIDVAACADMIKCKTIVGVHYDTFGFIKIDPEKSKKIFAEAGADLKLVKIEDSIDYEAKPKEYFAQRSKGAKTQAFSLLPYFFMASLREGFGKSAE